MAPFCKTIRSPRILTPTLHLIQIPSVWIKFYIVLSPMWVCVPPPPPQRGDSSSTTRMSLLPFLPRPPHIILTVTTNPSLFQKWLHSPNIIQVNHTPWNPWYWLYSLSCISLQVCPGGLPLFCFFTLLSSIPQCDMPAVSTEGQLDWFCH